MKLNAISIIVVAVLIGGGIFFGGNKGSNNSDSQALNDNVSVVDGKQTISINAKGGYFPRVTTAKAGLPTVIKVNTKGTFDCSSALVIPSIGYRGNLPPSGETTVDLPPQEAGTTINGLCSMGMYGFSVNFN